MSLLSTFSTNSINILAGVNGLEVSQSLIIAVSVALNDSLYLPIWPRIAFGDPGMPNELVVIEGGALLRRGSAELVQRHLLSLYFMCPLIAVCTALLYHNW
jgi:UDP-N-acetylglucosamine--dolichyl-phosphate N-acetylglucosaminephosphotransferase